MSQNPPYDQTPERSYNYLLEEEPARRSHNYGVSQRNKSYDLLLSKNTAKSIAGGPNLAQGLDKSILYMWGFLSGLGLDADFDKIGELDEELSDLSFSDGHVVLLTENNKVLVRGKNDCKQLGFDSKETLTSFKMLSLPSVVKFVRVECGGDFTFALGRDGEVFSWGLNIKGQLGHGHFEPVASAAQLKYLAYSSESRSPRVSRRSKDNSDDAKLSIGEKIVDVSCGALHSVLLTNKNRIFACGYGETFALGLAHRENQCTFCEVSYFSSAEFYDRKISKIATGVSHSACVANGTAYLWGVWGSKPQMVNQSPLLVSLASSPFADAASMDQVVDVKLGDLLTVLLTVKGDVYTLGDNTGGQLGLGVDTPNMVSPAKVSLDAQIAHISCGSNHVYCYSKDCKSVFSWGTNLKSQVMPFSQQKRFLAPQKVTSVVKSISTKIVCSSRATISVSRLPIDFTGNREEKASGDAVKKLEMLLLSERNEKENLKKANFLMSNELGQLKQQVSQLKSALEYAETSQKRSAVSSVSTQTRAEQEEAAENTFDGTPG